MGDREHEDEAARNSGLRSGGDVETKGASRDEPSDEGPATRSGGDVETKGVSRDEPDGDPQQPE